MASKLQTVKEKAATAKSRKLTKEISSLKKKLRNAEKIYDELTLGYGLLKDTHDKLWIKHNSLNSKLKGMINQAEHYNIDYEQLEIENGKLNAKILQLNEYEAQTLADLRSTNTQFSAKMDTIKTLNEERKILFKIMNKLVS